jgi:hypothetical protein
MNNKPDKENADDFGTDSQPSEKNGEENEQEDSSSGDSERTSSNGINRDRRRHSARNEERSREGSSVTLEGLITFFTYGSGVLLVLIIGFFVYNQLVGSSGPAKKKETQSNAPDDREGVSVSTAEGTSIDSLDMGGLDLTTQAGRNKIEKTLNETVSEIRDSDAFRPQHEEHLNGVKKHIQTLLDHIKHISDTGTGNADLKQKADRSSKNAEKLIQELTNAYEGEEQVLKKIKDLNFDVLWEVQEQREKIMDQR